MKKIEKFQDVKIPYNGDTTVVRIKRFSWGELHDIHREATKVNIIGSISKVDLDVQTIQELSVLRGIVDAPFPHSVIAEIKLLDPETGEALFRAIDEFNSLSKKKE